MKIKLAGFNVDVENINTLNKVLGKYPDISNEEINNLKSMHWTPETMSASYARISRDPRAISELREEAGREVDKARKSNKLIIFGLGHSSVAEHAVFNIDILEISRLVSEKLEKSRLVSFTEKSQRYIKIGNDILYPAEFEEDKAFLEEYKKLTNELFEAYNILHDKILPYFIDKNPDVKPDSREYNDIINLAKEDARYILPLGTLTQLGMTINARNLEKVIRRLASGPLAESRELGKKLFEVVDGYAPSLVKYTEATPYELETFKEIKVAIGEIIKNEDIKEEVALDHFDKEFENDILACFVVKSSGLSFSEAKKIVAGWDDKKKKEVFASSIEHLNSYDSLLREYEMSDFVFNIVMSATCFAQFKRHRMATIIDGIYSPSLGVKVPASIIESDCEEFFIEKIDKINKLYYKAKDRWPSAADYILTNAHRKNVILKCNFRELVHIARLRSDKHAQWDIRNISDQMMVLVKPELSFLSDLLCGKDDFENSAKE